MFCKKCGQKIEDGQKLCSFCGEPVEKDEPDKTEPEQPAEPEKEAPPREEKKEVHYCSHCGQRLDAGVKYCPYCGYSVGDAHAHTNDAPQPAPHNKNAGQPSAPKSRVLAAVLAFCMGTLGVHNMYLGYKKGWVQLGLTLAGFVTFGFTTVFSVVWALVDCVMLFGGFINEDGDGNPLV